MADRRGPDDRPLAPHRPLSGSPREDLSGSARRPSVAASSSGSAPRSSGSASRPGPRTSSGASSSSSTTSTSTSGTGTGTASKRPRGTRRARLRLVHLDPWSVLKTAFLLSIAFGIVTVVAVAVVWSVLDTAGVWDSINTTVADLVGGDSAQSFDVENYVGFSRVVGFTMVIAVVDVFLATAISTLGAFLYNLAAALLGGIEVTLAEDDR